MLAHGLRAAVLFALIAVQPLLAQEPASDDSRRGESENSQIPTPRLAAGLRAYPAGVRRALLLLAAQPRLLQQLAARPDLLRRPEAIDPAPAPEVQAAIRALQRVPQTLRLLVEHPDELARLRKLYADARYDMEGRLTALQSLYEAAALDGARFWQRLLEENPGALDAYRELLTGFCRERLQEYAAFPHVSVRRREYYSACPPDVRVLAYAREQGIPDVLQEVLQRWAAEFGPERVDGRVLSGQQHPLDAGGPQNSVADLSPEQRGHMWRQPGAADVVSLGLIPVILQPLADQPADARLAYAVAEHVRLWAPLPPAEGGEGAAEAVAQGREPPAAGLPAGQAQAQVAADEPVDDGFVPWPEAMQWQNAHDHEDYYYGDTPTYVRYYPRSYRIYRVYPYSGGYAWRWPVHTGYPDTYRQWSRESVWEAYITGSTEVHAEYRGSYVRITFTLGDGGVSYYDYPVSASGAPYYIPQASAGVFGWGGANRHRYYYYGRYSPPAGSAPDATAPRVRLPTDSSHRVRRWSSAPTGRPAPGPSAVPGRPSAGRGERPSGRPPTLPGHERVTPRRVVPRAGDAGRSAERPAATPPGRTPGSNRGFGPSSGGGRRSTETPAAAPRVRPSAPATPRPTPPVSDVRRGATPGSNRGFGPSSGGGRRSTETPAAAPRVRPSTPAAPRPTPPASDVRRGATPGRSPSASASAGRTPPPVPPSQPPRTQPQSPTRRR